MRTDHPRAPRREVRGSWEAVSGASGLHCGPGAREPGRQVGSASATGTPPCSKKWQFRFWKHYSGRGRRPTRRARWPPGVAAWKSSRRCPGPAHLFSRVARLGCVSSVRRVTLRGSDARLGGRAGEGPGARGRSLLSARLGGGSQKVPHLTPSFLDAQVQNGRLGEGTLW